MTLYGVSENFYLTPNKLQRFRCSCSIRIIKKCITVSRQRTLAGDGCDTNFYLRKKQKFNLLYYIQILSPSTHLLRLQNQTKII